MPSITTRVGVPSVYLSAPSATNVPSCATLVYTASAVSPTVLDLNDVNQPLLTTDTYQVIVGLVGTDAVNLGYTVGYCSPGSGILSISAGQVIQVVVPNANWPANFTVATMAAIFLKINNGNFQLAKFAYIDPSNDFVSIVMSKPLRAAANWTATILQSATVDPILGSRVPGGITYPSEISPTTGTFTFRRPVTTVKISPNNSADFDVATTRSVGMQFQSLVNDIKAFVDAAAGNYAQVLYNGHIMRDAEQALVTAQAIIPGNKPVLVFMPIDAAGIQEVRLLIGLLTVNQTELEEAWSKTAPTPVTFRFDAAALDKLVTNQHSQISYYFD